MVHRKAKQFTSLAWEMRITSYRNTAQPLQLDATWNLPENIHPTIPHYEGDRVYGYKVSSYCLF